MINEKELDKIFSMDNLPTLEELNLSPELKKIVSTPGIDMESGMFGALAKLFAESVKAPIFGHTKTEAKYEEDEKDVYRIGFETQFLTPVQKRSLATLIKFSGKVVAGAVHDGKTPMAYFEFYLTDENTEDEEDEIFFYAEGEEHD